MNNDNETIKDNNRKERNNAIDIAKGIGIICVLIGHLNHFFDYNSIVCVIIYSFHMPLFIFVSGYVFSYHEELSWSKYCYKRFLQIIRPYLIFGIVTLVFTWPENKETARTWLNGLFIGNGLNGNLDFNIALWFLPMLFCCNILFYFSMKISKCFKDKRISIIILICESITFTFVGYLLLRINKRYFWGIETACFSQIFMLVGYCSKLIKANKFFKNINIYLKFVFFIIASIIMWLGTKFNGRIDMNAGQYNNFLVFIITAISGIYIVLQVSIIISKIFITNKVLSKLGTSSLYIMAYHIPAATLLYDSIILVMPNFIQENVWKVNIIGLSYVIIGDIFLSLFMELLHYKLKTAD